MRTFADLASLKGRVAVVTGGAGHIGSAICRTFQELGALVVATDLPEALDRGNLADGVVGIAGDLRDPLAPQQLVDDVSARFGRLDVLVHAAAHVGSDLTPGWSVPFPEQSVQAWDAAVRLNLTSAFLLSQAARASLSASGHGSIVLMSSIYGTVAPDLSLYEGTAMNNPVAYGATKAALIQLARYLATHLSPAVRVNAVSPGGIERGQQALFIERYSARTPLRRMGREEDVVGAVAYLASDLSAYVTGHNLVVDGGWTAW